MQQKKQKQKQERPMQTNSIRPVELNIVAIGASAGGLEALQDFLSHLPEIKNVAIIVAQHLSPTHKSMLVQLLSRETQLEVIEAENGSTLQPDKIYITPPDKEISISAGKIVLKKPQSNIGPRPSINVLFESLAEDAAHQVVGIILSGTGSDGASGVRILKKNGGLIIAQEPTTAKYDGMPLAAIETGEVDLVLPPEKMGEEILEHFLNPDRIRIKQGGTDDENNSLEKIINILSKRTGTDFSNYKSATIIRRLEKRLAFLKIKSFDAYLKLLAESPKEQDDMFNMILIGVTTFFRDTEAFEALENNLHKIINAKINKDSIRIWVPGCYTGEEAYSIAILLHRILKDRILQYNIQIFATDIDENAIVAARKGIYSSSSLEKVPQAIIDTYFIRNENQYELVKSIRSMVLFSRHDITSNPPFLKLDLISCRNLLIYFGAGLQQQIIPIFHYALLQDGYLFLGKSETVGQYSDLFATIDGKNKIFQRKRGGNLRTIKFSSFKAQKHILPQQTGKQVKKDLSISELVKETIFNTYEHPYVVINEGFDILEVNGELRLFMSLAQGAIETNLLKMINSELKIEVRSVITKAIKGRETVRSSIKKFHLFENDYYVRITAKPLIFSELVDEMFIVIFEQLDLEEFVTKGIVANEHELVDVRLKELEIELATAKEHMQTYTEELETSNEELQSLNEELQSTNEELQSSNEELETSNEELQSTNEEIQITYSELKAANKELERKETALKEKEATTNALFNNKLQAFILIDNTYKVIKFNEKAEELIIRLHEKKIQQNDSFIDLIEPGQLEFFVRDFSRVAQGETISREIKLTGINNKEYWYSFSYSPVQYGERNIHGISIGILDITDLKIALNTLNEKEKILSLVYNATAIGLCVTDEQGMIMEVNAAFCRILGYQSEELIGKNFTLTMPGKNQKDAQHLQNQFIKSEKETPGEWEVLKKDGSTVLIDTTSELLQLPDGKRLKITSIQDITEQRNNQDILNASRLKYKSLIDGSLSAILLTRPDGTILEVNPAAEQIFGYTLDELTRIGRQGILEHVDEAGMNELLAKREKDGQVTGEITGIRKNGQRFPVEFSSVLFTDDNNNVYAYTIINDITEKKAIQQKLEANEKRFRAMVENGSDAIVIVDASAKPLYISPGVKNIVGYSDQEALELDSFKTIHPDDGDYIRNKLQESLDKPGIPIRNLSYRIKHKDGRWLFIEATITNLLHEPAIGGIVTNFSDVTQRKLIEEQLTSITNNLKGVVFRYKLNPDGTDQLMYLSKGSIDLWGIDAESAMKNNQLVWDVYHKDDLKAHKDSIRHSKETLTSWTHEWRVNHPDGTIHWQRGIGNPQQLPDGSVIWDSLIIDITSQKEQELELNRIKHNQESLINATKDMVWSVDKDLRIITANESYLQTMTYATSKPIKEGDPVIVEEFGEELVTKWKTYYKRALQGEKYTIEEQVYNPISKRTEFGLISFNPIYNSNGDIFGVACYSKDITELVLKQQEVINTKNELDKIMDYSPDVVCTMNEAGEFVKISAASEKIWGYKPEELIGRKYMDLVHPADHEKTNKAAEDIIAGKEMTNFENHYIRKDGTVIPVIWSAKWDQQEKLMFCIAKDGTEKYEADLKIRESENRFKSLVQDGSDLIGILDIEANYSYVSPTSLQILGYTPEELIGKNAFSFIHPDDEERTRAVFGELTEKKKIAVPHFRFKNKKGEWRWIETTITNLLEEPSIQGIIANSRDITERKIAEEKVLYEQQEKEALINSTDDMIWSVDRNLRLIAGNRSFLKSIETSSGKQFSPGDKVLLQEYPESFLKEWKAYYKKALEGTSFRKEIVSTYSDNKTLRWLETAFNPIYSDAEIVGIACYSRDITERKTAEEEKNFKAQLLNTIGQAAIATDLNGTVIFWNQAAEKIYGWSASEAIGKSIMTLTLDEHTREEAAAIMKQLSKGKSWSGEFKVRRKNGETFPALVTNSPIYDQDGKLTGIIGISTDITEQKKAAQSLMESNLRYEYVTKATFDAIWDWDIEGEKIFWGDGYLELFGMMEEPGLTQVQTVVKRLHPEEVENVLASARSALKSTNNNWSYEHRYLKTDGTFAFVSNRAVIIRNDAGKAIRVIGAMQDISRRKAREEQLKLLESVILNTNDAVLITEAEPIDDPGPRIVYVNDAFTKMTGYSAEEVIGKTPRILQGPKTNRAELDKLKKALQKWEPCEITIINYKKTGEEFWINLSISPVANEKGWFTHWISIERDVTGQKKTEETIRSINERYDLAAKATSDVIWDWDLVTGGVVRSKESMKKLFGFTHQEEMENETFWSSRVHPEDIEWIKEKFKKFFADPKALYMDHEYRFKKADGSYAYINDKGFVIRDAKGKAIRMIGAAQDITKLKENELQLQQTNAELEKRAKELAYTNEELEQFAYIASHDLQEPLRMVSSFLVQIEKKYQSLLDDRGKQYIHFAVDGSKRMRQIILDLLEYSRVGRLHDDEMDVDLNSIISEIQILFRKKINEINATIISKNLPVIRVNKTPIRQVFQNLIGNALMYSKENKPPVIKIEAKDKKTYWEFSVADNGIGIDKEYFEKIFIMFQRLHSREEFAGTGMGLALTKKIIEHFGGRIWVKSVEGKGSTFFFRLPKNR